MDVYTLARIKERYPFDQPSDYSESQTKYVDRNFPYGRRHRDGALFQLHYRRSTGRVNGRLRQFVTPASRMERFATGVIRGYGSA